MINLKPIKTFVTFSSVLLFIIATVCLYAIEATIGDIKVTQDYNYRDMTGIYIQVYDVNAYKMKDKRIEFSGGIEQANKWISELTIKIEPQVVQYEHSIWKGPSIWFFYSYDELKKNNVDLNKEFIFRIFVKNLDGVSNDYVQKDKVIKVNLGSEPSLDNKELQTPEIDDKCYKDCMQRNMMRSVSAEQIESDCKAECNK